MNIVKYIGIIFIIISLGRASSAEDNLDILNFLKKSEDYTYFYKLIKKAKYEKLFLNEAKFKKVLYIPSNAAFDKLSIRLKKYIWDNYDNTAAKKIIKTHLYSGSIKQVFKDPNKKVIIIDRIEVNGEKVRIFSNSDLFVKDMVDQKKVITKENIEIIPVSCVMYLQPSYSDTRLSDDEKNNSTITSCCMLSDQEVDSFMKGGTI